MLRLKKLSKKWPGVAAGPWGAGKPAIAERFASQPLLRATICLVLECSGQWALIRLIVAEALTFQRELDQRDGRVDRQENQVHSHAVLHVPVT